MDADNVAEVVSLIRAFRPDIVINVALPSIGIWTEAGDFRLVKTFGYEDFTNRLL